MVTEFPIAFASNVFNIKRIALADVNSTYLLCIRWGDALSEERVRYKLWDGVGEILDCVDLYEGQVIGDDAVLEVWTVLSDEISAESLNLNTSLIVEVDCEDTCDGSDVQLELLVESPNIWGLYCLEPLWPLGFDQPYNVSLTGAYLQDDEGKYITDDNNNRIWLASLLSCAAATIPNNAILDEEGNVIDDEAFGDILDELG